MATYFDIDDGIRINAEFRNMDDVVADPTTITFKIKDPSGHIDTYTYALSQVTKASVGNYYRDLIFDEAGKWTVKWTGTGIATSGVKEYIVRDSEFD